MDARLFPSDLAQVPERLADLARRAAAGELAWPVTRPPRRILLTGMGSSWFAATTAAARLRAAGLDAVAELASAELTWPPSPDLLVVAISASGESAETLRFAERHRGSSTLIALTNTPGSSLARLADDVVLMHAAAETSGVACRSYRHTIALLRALEDQLTDGAPQLAGSLARAAGASTDLLDRRGEWLPGVLATLEGGDATWFVAPNERWCSSLQGALMLREVAGRLADGCETGDWSHVDFHIAGTVRYRAVVFAGSVHDPIAAGWMERRGATAVAVGGPFTGARHVVRYRHDDDPSVAVLTEVLVAELIADAWATAQFEGTR